MEEALDWGPQFWTDGVEEGEEAEGNKAGVLCALVASVCCTANDLPTHLPAHAGAFNPARC